MFRWYTVGKNWESCQELEQLEDQAVSLALHSFLPRPADSGVADSGVAKLKKLLIG